MFFFDYNVFSSLIKNRENVLGYHNNPKCNYNYLPIAPPAVLPPPEIRCVSVDINGDVTLTWIPITDIGNSFISYHVFVSPSLLGVYVDIGSVSDINQSSFIHNGAGANTQSLYYYVNTEYNNAGVFYSSPSDTLKSIKLNVSNSGIGTAILSWNTIHNPNLASSLGIYNIYRQAPSSSWILIGSTQSLSYIDTITYCNDNLNYYVEIEDLLGCKSISSIDGGIFQDIIAPYMPQIDSVSVDFLSGYSVIGWKPSASKDTKGYIIYEDKNGILVSIGTVLGINNTFFVNNNQYWSNPDSSSLSYYVAAFDYCGNTSPMSVEHKTIFLTSVFDVCNNTIDINWTPYVNMNPAITGYRIYMKENAGPVTLLATNTSTNTSYTYSPTTPFSTYIFFVQAFNGAEIKKSFSNTDTVYAGKLNIPQYVYLRYATVMNNNYVEIKGKVDVLGYISNCKIMRAEYAAGPYIKIGDVTPESLTDIINYDDYSVDVNKNSYYYKMVIVDSCGNDAVISNVGRTIYLSVDASSDMENTLSWNEYESWLGDISSYNIYRKVDDVWETIPLISLPKGTTSYIDDVSDLINTDGKFVYLVQANEGLGNIYLFNENSQSNEAIATQSPRLFIPNAFTPKGLNSIFIPYCVFVDTKDYIFTIYNRWGRQVFQTNNPNLGWDGSFEGNQSPQGVYIYSVKYKNSQNVYIEKTGSVTLLR